MGWEVSMHNKAFLICEEEPEVKHYLEMAIKSFGYSVQSAPDGNAVLSVLRSAEVEVSA